MTMLLKTLISLVALQQIKAINLKNNVCKSYYDYPFRFLSNQCYYNADIDLNPLNLALKYGFNGKKYEITTQDGYILNVYRIRSKNNETETQPIFLMHGIGTNCLTFINNGYESLGFHLANAGYDVWLGSYRGTTFSKRHKTYSVTSPKFWEFNLDDLAKFDLAAQIHFVANETKKAGSLIYMGHSQGTTLIFMLASESEEIQDILKGIVALSPVAYFHKLPGLIYALKIYSVLFRIFATLNIKGLFYQNSVRPLTLFLCHTFPYGCVKLMNLLFGKLSEKFSSEDLIPVFNSFPSGTSVYQLLHFTQIAVSGNFQKYDYGNRTNFEIYEQNTPPKYNLSNIVIPTVLFYGQGDTVSSECNARLIYEELGSKDKSIQKIPPNGNISFNHIDFMYGKFLPQLFYEPLVKTLQEKLKA